MELKNNMKTLTECFEIILTGDREASRMAAREVRRLVYSSQGDHDKYRDIKNLINGVPNKYAKIFEEWRQENFVMAVSVMYFLHDRENQPDFLFPWLFYLLQHENGNIRHAAVRMLEHELGPLTVHIRFPRHKPDYFGKLTPEKADAILYSLFINLNELMRALWQPRYKKYKYISSLPSGPYKSVQMVFGHLQEDCGEEYMERLASKLTSLQTGVCKDDVV